MYCQFVLNNSNKCICKTAYHNIWEFGEKVSKYKLYFDVVNSIYNDHTEHFNLSNEHYMFFNSNHLNNINTSELYNKEGKYFINCNCSYCLYSNNKYLNIYKECFCCKSRLYIKNNSNNNDYIYCYECNSILCNNCFIQGRYKDNEQLYCFECRPFTIHKNQRFYFENDIDPDYDWESASWYY